MIEMEEKSRASDEELSGSLAEVMARQKALVALGRRAVAPPECSILIHDAACLVGEMLHADFGYAAEVSVGRGELDVCLVEPTTGAVESDDSLTPRRSVSIDSRASLAGNVLALALPAAIYDITENRGFHDPFLRKNNILGVIAAPLMLIDRSFGAVGACFRTARKFREDDILFVETVSHLVATTIARSQTDQWLREERRFNAGLFETFEAIVLILDRQGLVTKSNAACERATGFSFEELRGRRLEATFALPDEAYLFRSSLGRVLSGETPVEFESRLLTKHSERRHVAWTLAALGDSSSRSGAVVVTGIDVTRERELEAKLLKSAAASGSQPDDLPQASGDRRKRPRRPYPYRQMIAPIFDGKMPAPRDFVAVTCNDIGAGGFSFLSQQPVTSEEFIVTLGTPPTLTYLKAKVVHINRVEHEGRFVYVVGCTYTGRAG